jgi:hypothetical protein
MPFIMPGFFYYEVIGDVLEKWLEMRPAGVMGKKRKGPYLALVSLGAASFWQREVGIVLFLFSQMRCLK